MRGVVPESIEGFIEAQVFMQSVPRPPLPPPRQLVVYISQPFFSCVSSVPLTDGRGEEGDGRGAKSYYSKKAWPFLKHLILSGWYYGGTTRET
jgi:hypothetical protein